MALDSFLTSTAIVAIGEIGDKTQLLSILLASRYRAPWTIAAAVLAATTANHALATWVGDALRSTIDPHWLRWIVGISFLAMAVWVLVPDSAPDTDSYQRSSRSVFLLTFVAFFAAEMGDKTQIATVALAARFGDVVAVLAGTTLGMMLANAPAIWFGAKAVNVVPLGWIRGVSALLMAAAGVWALMGMR
jgi:Ca2+/H+ antiporter, TMEM165/GDT1 family